MDEEYRLAETYEKPGAHWGLRIVAYLIDMAIITLIVFALFAASPEFTVWKGIMTLVPVFPPFFFIFLIHSTVVVLYFIVFEAAYNATLGKFVCNLRVYALGGKLTVGAAFWRNISKFWWIMTILDFVIGWTLYADSKQRIMDIVANTIVVNVEPVAEPAPVPVQVYIPPPVYARPEPRAELERYTIDEMPEEWLQHGNCPRCGTPFKIVKEEHRYKLIGPWMNRCTWCDRLFDEREFDFPIE